MSWLLTWISASTLVLMAKAEFSNDFRAFLHNKYGLAIVNQLERRDLGADASLGGKQPEEPTATPHQPVVIVHGITNKISRFNGIVVALKARGYTSAEVFGTTWGDGGVTPAGLVDMKCAYVKQVRSMIIAVREYTGRKVDVVAYSMGSPIARKAILGGNCVESREVLGPPLTEHIDTFLSVAGANYGSSLCIVPIPIGTCNRKSGLHCESEFLADINSSQRYEGAHIFSLFSTGDEKKVTFVDLAKGVKTFAYTEIIEQMPDKQHIKIFVRGASVEIRRSSDNVVLKSKSILEENQIFVNDSYLVKFEEIGVTGSQKWKVVVTGSVVVADPVARRQLH